MSATSVTAGYVKDFTLFEWSEFRIAMPTRTVVALALSLFIGIALGHPGGGLVAAAGAFTTGFGAFQSIGRSRIAPLLLASLGISFSTGVGMVLGHNTVWFVVVSGLWALLYGVLIPLEAGMSWVSLQCVIVLLVGSAFHTHISGALVRCSLMLAGGLLQTLIALAFEHFHLLPDRKPLTGMHGQTRLGPTHPSTLQQWMRSAAAIYALRLGLTVAAGAEIYRRAGMTNGYWLPMTALIVLKPDFHQTAVRSVLRVSGTLIGGGLAGLIAAWLHPSVLLLAVLILFFAWCSYAVFNVNYGLYAVGLTGYIVFLLALDDIPPVSVIHHRALFTALGGALAVLAHLDVLRRRSWAHIRHRAVG